MKLDFTLHVTTIFTELTLGLLANPIIGLTGLTRPVGRDGHHLAVGLSPAGYCGRSEHHLPGTADGTALMMTPAEALISVLTRLGGADPRSEYVAAGA